MNDFGRMVRHARIARGWSQTELGQRVGVSGSAVGLWEANRTRPAPTLAARLANVLSLPESSTDNEAREQLLLTHPKEIALVRAIRALPPKRQSSTLDMLLYGITAVEVTQREPRHSKRRR